VRTEVILRTEELLVLIRTERTEQVEAQGPYLDTIPLQELVNILEALHQEAVHIAAGLLQAQEVVQP
jgi:hypothetical protein